MDLSYVQRSILYDGSLAEYATKINVSKICFGCTWQPYKTNYYYDCYSRISDINQWFTDEFSKSSSLAELLREKVLTEDNKRQISRWHTINDGKNTS